MNATQARTQSGSYIGRPSASPRGRRAALWTLGGLAGLLALGWLGLQVNPAPFPAISGLAAALKTIPLLSGLPTPVERSEYGREPVHAGKRVVTP